MNSHTPGPWRFDASYSTRAEREVASTHDWTVIAPGGWFASPPKRDERDDWPEDTANARLIAAAPELLSALEEIFGLLEHQLPTWYLRKHYAVMVSAIRKATETP